MDNTSGGEAAMRGAAFESWERSEDGTVYTMHLRRDIVDSFGNPLKAEDAKWIFERTMAEPNCKYITNNLTLTSPDQIKVVDDYTLEFTLPGPNPVFLRTLYVHNSTPFGVATARQHATNEDPWAEEWLKMNAPATGPYMVESWKAGESLVLVRNPNWYGEPPAIDRVIYRLVPEAASRVALLIAGDVDIAHRLDKDQLDTVDQAEGSSAICVPAQFFTFVGLNTQKGVTANREVRQALAYAVPYEDILSSVYGGRADPLWSFVPGNHPNVLPRSANPYKYDLEKAKELLTEAGYPDGFDLNLLVSSAIPEHQRIAVLIKDSFAKIGVNVTIDMKPHAAYEDRAFARDVEAVIVEDFSMVLDVTYAAGLMLPDSPPPNMNYTGFTNPEFSQLREEGLVMPEGPERAAKQIRMQEIMIEESPWLFLANPRTCYGIRDNVVGYTWHVSNKMRLDDLDIVE
jgi:peptide/nickel transport system substrate-binding protein